MAGEVVGIIQVRGRTGAQDGGTVGPAPPGRADADPTGGELLHGAFYPEVGGFGEADTHNRWPAIDAKLPRSTPRPTVWGMSQQAKAVAGDGGEKLSIQEIERRYPDEWVVLVDTDWVGMKKITEGVVVAHSPSKREAYEMACGLRSVAVLWTGKIQSPVLWALMNVRRPV